MAIARTSEAAIVLTWVGEIGLPHFQAVLAVTVRASLAIVRASAGRIHLGDKAIDRGKGSAVIGQAASEVLEGLAIDLASAELVALVTVRAVLEELAESVALAIDPAVLEELAESEALVTGPAVLEELVALVTGRAVLEELVASVTGRVVLVELVVSEALVTVPVVLEGLAASEASVTVPVVLEELVALVAWATDLEVLAASVESAVLAASEGLAIGPATG